jgi:acyl-lipid omega-6 desaturase (Delta-12 desaturase)
MYVNLDISYWLTLLLAFPATGFMVRMFIIQHDCGHGSFFESRKANDLVGMLCSIFTLTPYHYWRTSHAIHHAGAGKLEARGIGDIHTKTVTEYLELSGWGRFKYRLYRNPFILFVFVPTILFLVLYRFPNYKHKELLKFQKSVYLTSLIIASLMGILIWLIGIKDFLLIQLPITVITSSTGAWLFFVQHQFEDTYWAKRENWDFEKAALEGSSYYKLPKILQWFTGNIGFHHIHHLSPKIPNYLLEKCQKENIIFQKARTLTLRTSLKSMFLTLWDENQKKLISFRQLRHLKLNMLTAK